MADNENTDTIKSLDENIDITKSLDEYTDKELTTVFQKHAEKVTTLKTTPDNDTKLKLYGLFKQAKDGDNETPQPGFLDFVGKKKWEAWTSRKGLSAKEAETKYIELVRELIDKHGVKEEDEE
ncbi:hypothetical protein GGI25_002177 [Coemansia spiralis]|uniref:ACB domain-containing protein n=2 Tax=Coemansia TaxID=4863 RepID=A0A9W8G458_9FUNG|nr:acyl CoA binding protein-domain-containing protein [Coemansia spiralis]KAJ1996186.1 hypothetical protein EDC05_000076 [Coemansia umbellata]KAJ2626057.1 hypothetical protein GGI26_000141 [Coemansia sp. RSA 1358]KAJ2678589.1 hypothetical protein GGI25_002177 [Coemansia spiralis]